MTIRLLVVDPNPGFAMMIKQVLEEAGGYHVTVVETGAEAIQVASTRDFDLAIVDMDLPDMPAAEVVQAIRATRPRLAIVGIPIEGRESELDGLDLQGTLPKPFFIPDLPSILEEALSRPVGGAMPEPSARPRTLPAIEEALPPGQIPVTANSSRAKARPTPPARSVPPTRPAQDDQPILRPAPKVSEMPPPPWLLDADQARQCLSILIPETVAEAALITRGDRRWASFGSFDEAEMEELTRLAAEDWARDGGAGALAKFVRLSGGSRNCMLYSLPLAGDLVISLIFEADTPMGLIRRQARQLAQTLTQKPPGEATPHIPPFIPGASERPDRSRPRPAQEPLRHVDPFLPSTLPPLMSGSKPALQPTFDKSEAAPTPHSLQPDSSLSEPPEGIGSPTTSVAGWETAVPIVQPVEPGPPAIAPGAPVKDASPSIFPVEPFSDQSSTMHEGPFGMPDHRPLDLDGYMTGMVDPFETVDPELLQFAAPDEVDADAEAPVVPAESSTPAGPQASIVGLERSASGPNRLTYTFVMIPKLPDYRMIGDLSSRMEEMLRHYAVACHWRVDRLSIRDDHVVLALTCSPTTSPDRIMRMLRRLTSERVAAEFPRLMRDDPSEDFWAKPYMLFISDYNPLPNQIADFVDQVRRQQGLVS